MKVKNQKRLASEILGVGKHRVFIDPTKLEDVKKAITKEDIRNLIKEEVIRKRNKKGISRYRAKIKTKKRKSGQMKGQGKRKGTKNARFSLKRAWINKIRILRKELREMKSKGEIDTRAYRKAYRQAKGNLFKGKRYLREHLSIIH